MSGSRGSVASAAAARRCGRAGLLPGVVSLAATCASAIAQDAATPAASIESPLWPAPPPALVAGLAVVSTGLLLELVRLNRRLRALARDHAKLGGLLRTAQPALFVAVDASTPDRTVRYASAGLAATLGRSAEDLSGRPFRTFLRRRDSATVQRLFESAASTGRSALTEAALVRADGREVPVLLSVYPPSGGGDENREVLVGAVDVTEQKRNEDEERRSLAQLTHSEKLKSLEILAGGVAHDFNNLLVGVLGNADLALMDLSPLSPARASVEAIKTAAVQASDLTRQMLAYSGRGHFLVERIDLPSAIRSMAPLLKVSVSGKVTLHYDVDPDLPPIEADLSQLRQLLVSLATNASDAIGSRNGVVTVRAHLIQATREYLATTYVDEDLPEGSYVCLDVSDTGCGMDDAGLARVFDPFYSTKPYGRGFGLATVLSIVRGHKGAIRVDSTLGKGTTFTMLFPAAERETPSTAATALDDVDSEAMLAGTVLVIDDEETVRHVTEGMLSRMGCRVLLAAGGVEGVARLRDSVPAVDAVLLNMTMPGMNGLETLRALKTVRPDVPVVLCTGYGEAATAELFKGERLAGFIQKPFDARELNRMLNRILGSARSLAGRRPVTTEKL